MAHFISSAIESWARFRGHLESLCHDGCDNTLQQKFKKYYHDGILIGLSCNECLSEWVTVDLVEEEHRGESLIRFEQKNFYFVAKPKESACFTQTEIEDVYNLAGSLTRGDHITGPSFGGFQHHAIVIDVQGRYNGPDKVTLIHWQGGPLSMMVIKETIKDISKRYSKVCKCNYTHGSEDKMILTIARAEAWAGAVGYDPTENNCEHFAVFCKTGWHRSFQGEAVAALVSGIARLMIKHTDEPVENISELSVGDQISMYMTVIHPRCHMIVTSVDVRNRKMKVIRFTYERGVVEEYLKFPKHDIYKIKFETETFRPEQVIERARNSSYTAKDYGILTFNCKHFAFWCTTNQIPTERY